jgi:hypothetical protein
MACHQKVHVCPQRGELFNVQIKRDGFSIETANDSILKQTAFRLDF